MKNHSLTDFHRRGGAMMMALLVLVLFCLFPLVLMLVAGNAKRTRDSSHILKTRKYREYLRSAPQQVSWGLKEGFQTDHYNKDVIGEDFGRSLWWDPDIERDYSKGSRPVVFSSAPAKILAVTAFLSESEKTTDRKQFRHLTNVFTFRNDALRFGLVVENPLTIGPLSPLDRTTLTDGVYVNGNLDVSGSSNLIFQGNSLMVNGNVLGGPGMTLSVGALLYSSGVVTNNGADIWGNVYNKILPMDIVPIDLNYYLAHNRQIVAPTPPAVSTSVVWTFMDDPATSLCRCYTDDPPTIFWEAHELPGNVGWPIFVVQDGNITLRGTCSSKVTVVSFTTTPSGSSGNVFIDSSQVGQSDGSTVSSSTRAFAVVASNTIMFNTTGAGGPITARGYYRASQIGIIGSNPVTVEGTLHTLTGFSNSTDLNAKFNIQFDPDLFKNLPPGVPERPVLVTYTSKE